MALIAFTLVSQIGFYRASTPIVQPDTSSYQVLATKISAGDWYGFYFRTPGYPIFLALVEMVAGSKNYQAVLAVQYVLGSLIPLLLYGIYLPIVRSRSLAACVAASYFLDRHSVGVQSVILTEFLAQFALLACLAFYFWAVAGKRYGTAPLVGLAFFVLAMIRPSFQMLYVCVAFGGPVLELLYREGRSSWRRVLLWNGLLFATVQVLMWGWSYKIYRDYGHFTVSMQLGASLTNQTGDIMEQAPERFGVFRDLYLKEKRAKGGDHINVIEQVLHSVSKATGLPVWEVSIRYLEIDKYLISHNPRWYLRRIYYGWIYIWKSHATYLYKPSSFYDYAASNWFYKRVYAAMDKGYWNVTWLVDLVPYLFFAVAFLLAWLRRIDRFLVLRISILAGVVFYNQFLTILIQFTEFGRYRLPIQPLYLPFLLGSLLLAIRWLFRHKRRPAMA